MFVAIEKIATNVMQSPICAFRERRDQDRCGHLEEIFDTSAQTVRCVCMWGRRHLLKSPPDCWQSRSEWKQLELVWRPLPHKKRC